MSDVKNLKKENLFHLFLYVSVDPQIHTFLQIETIAKKMDVNQQILNKLSTVPFEKVDYEESMVDCLCTVGGLFLKIGGKAVLSNRMELKITMEKNNFSFIVTIGQMEKSIEILEKR
jgi:hypothetical protein